MKQRRRTSKKSQSTRTTLSNNKALIFVLLALSIIVIVSLYIKMQTDSIRIQEDVQETPTYNQPTAVIGFTPESLAIEPQEVNVGTQFTVSIMITPQIHKISSVKPVILYDNTVLRVDSVTVNNQKFPLISEKVDTSKPGIVSFSASINPPIENAIQETSPVAEITFRALKKTAEDPTEISFDSATRALSLSLSDGPQANVIATKNSAFIIIR